MSLVTSQAIEVFSIRDIARAAGVRPRDVRGLIESGAVLTIDGRFARPADAIRAVRLLRGEPAPADHELFQPPASSRRSGGGLAASGAIHAALLLGLIVLSTLGLSDGAEKIVSAAPLRLVFLPLVGPGGGGGGGGLKQPAPPPPAELRGPAKVRSPIPPPRRLTSRPPEPKPVVRSEAPQPTPHPVDPPPVAKPEVAPQVVAPLATAPADTHDRAGVVSPAPAASVSQGPGTGSGAGTGQGTGLGEGNGSGVGPGTGGGTGGGPYRPGSGITPPGLLREVRPDYTEEARRRGISGDVVLEIVVRSDGTVGDIKLLHGLGAGLDQRASDAVRGWRFSPAKRYGTPVDVLVEVAVEFKLR